MAVRQDEPVAVEPTGVSGVVPQDPCEKHVGQGSERHRGAWVSRVRPLRPVHRETAYDVDAALFDT
jgi:hypothetical protein